MNPVHAPRGQRGQAMVEFVVSAMFFLVPLFLAISALGKFLDVQHTTEMAGRYAAWERTVWYDGSSSTFNSFNAPNSKTADAISHELGARLLSDRSTSTTVIRDTDKNATSFLNGIDPMWQDAAGKKYLDTYAQMTAPVTSEAPKKDVAGKVLETLGKIGVKGVIGFVPPVPTDTMAVATVKFSKVGEKSEVYKRLWSETPVWAGLEFESTGAILSNTWGANARAGTTSMVKATVPTAGPVGQFIDTASLALGAWDASLFLTNRLEVGKLAVDELPPDRLK